MHPVDAHRVGRDFVVIFETQGIYRVAATALLKTALISAEDWTAGSTLPDWALTSLLSFGLSRQKLSNKPIDTVLAARAEDVLSEILKRAVARGEEAAENLARLALSDWQRVWIEFSSRIKVA